MAIHRILILKRPGEIELDFLFYQKKVELVPVIYTPPHSHMTIHAYKMIFSILITLTNFLKFPFSF